MVMIFLNSFRVQAATNDVELTLSFTGLADPGDDHYEGWLIVDGKAIPAGKFTVDTDGKLTDLDGNAKNKFTVEDVDLELATDYVLTLELKGDTDTTPNSIKPFAGKLNAEKSSASISHNIGVDFSSVSGDYILATPTNGANTSENSGIWYLDPTSGSPIASLSLPDLSGTDWIYEGWVIVDGIAITTGTFDKMDTADNSAPFSDTVEAAPPFPGEDYLKNAPSGVSFPVDLAGQMTAITVEPRTDNSPAPFQFHPLFAEIPANAVDHTLYGMVEEVSKYATGTVLISEDANALPGFGIIQVIFAVGLIGFIINRRR